MPNSALEAALHVLSQADGPLHYREIADRALASGHWQTEGKTPAASINAQLATLIKRKGKAAGVCRVSPGTFTLTGRDPQPPGEPGEPQPAAQTLSFTDAADHVLRHAASREAMHYRDITAEAQRLGLLSTRGLTPEATMYAQIIQECQRRSRRGERLRFDRRGKGMVALTEWSPQGLTADIEAHNRKVKKSLRSLLAAVEPGQFEELVGRLLGEIGFADIEVTQRRGDGGIDVRGTLVVGEVIRTRMAVQVKRWKNNVRTPTVREVRGSLGAHEQGLIITTSSFGKGAIEEAQRADATPIGLMDGETLVGLLVEHGIGVERAPHELLTLTDLQSLP